jgi:hypothetical protein
MIISYLCGGLGNQMFQYAAGRRLAHQCGTELKLDLGEYSGGTDVRPAGLEEYRRPLKLRELCATVTAATPEEIRRLRDPYSVRTTIARIVRRIRRLKPRFLWPPSHVRERQFRFDPRIMELPDNVYLDGFWQSWRYFDDIADVLRREFTARDPQIAPYAKQYTDRLRSTAGGAPLVSLHVRRGDLATAHEQLNAPGIVHGAPVGTEYVESAMQRFGPDCHFLIFSDTPRDIEWCRLNIKPDWLPPAHRHFAEGHSDIQDMAIMSACDHNIIANSTFSWWGAWLNPRSGRRVIAPKQFSAAGSPREIETVDLIPPSWEMIG